MKRLILLTTLLLTPSLFSCANKEEEPINPPTYLELWNKMTTYDKNGKISKEETCEYNVDKKISHQVIRKVDEGYRDTYDFTYNDHGDMAEAVVTKEDDTNDSFIVIDKYIFTYTYDEDGFMTSKVIDVEDADNGYFANHFTYEYDDLKRLIHERGYAVLANEEEKTVYEDFFTYESTFTTFKTHKHYGEYASDYTYTENIFDQDGYPSEQYYNNVVILSNKHLVFTYDDYHCLVNTKTFNVKSDDTETLLSTIEGEYYKHNPNKPKTLRTISAEGEREHIVTYTYDEYDRTTMVEYTENENSDEEDISKITYEYNELIEG